ncbi:hypothetical protein [Streptomyces sp. BR123]|uniref:hypothetical protein n=1 Tax=Streptomyces sp. BR123 TaxID=2749828 RepID=UPI00211AFC81|nr:hypothetical protein [Streptomyces sp. BR123]
MARPDRLGHRLRGRVRAAAGHLVHRRPGTLDEQAIAHYRETGTVIAEWDCGPASGDGDDAAPVQPETTLR